MTVNVAERAPENVKRRTQNPEPSAVLGTHFEKRGIFSRTNFSFTVYDLQSEMETM